MILHEFLPDLPICFMTPQGVLLRLCSGAVIRHEFLPDLPICFMAPLGVLFSGAVIGYATPINLLPRSIARDGVFLVFFCNDAGFFCRGVFLFVFRRYFVSMNFIFYLGWGEREEEEEKKGKTHTFCLVPPPL